MCSSNTFHASHCVAFVLLLDLLRTYVEDVKIKVCCALVHGERGDEVSVGSGGRVGFLQCFFSVLRATLSQASEKELLQACSSTPVLS